MGNQFIQEKIYRVPFKKKYNCILRLYLHIYEKPITII